jgi:DNA repair protein RecO (recombination protein O)
VILRRRDVGDADRVLTVFTPDRGKMELIGKGIRKTTSRKAGHLELFTHVSFLAAQARTWDIITEAQAIQSFRHLRTDLDTIGQASYVAELIDAFTQSEDENQLLWDLLLLVLRELDESVAGSGGEEETGKVGVGVLMRWFELHLLGLVGFQPELFHCLNCGEDLQPVTNYLSIQDASIYCPRCGESRGGTEPIEVDVLKVLRYLQSRPWATVRSLTVRPVIMNRVESILYRTIVTVLERQLKSVGFMRHVRK